MTAAVAFLREVRPSFVDLDVRVEDGRVVRSAYADVTSARLREFETTWSDPGEVRTEYLWGLSIVHDVKDHVLYGLSFTPLTEIQTIVQTYLGRELSDGRSGRCPGGDVIGTIRRHIAHEMFALDGRPLVYDPAGQRGLLDVFAPSASTEERRHAFIQMVYIAEHIMIPELSRLYHRHAAALALQASIRDQPELQRELLAGLIWCDRRQLLMRLCDNAQFATRVRAYIDDELAACSARIAEAIAQHAVQHGLERFGAIFDPTGYLLPRREAA